MEQRKRVWGALRARGEEGAVALLALLLAGCSDPGPGPEIHDTKYVFVGLNGEYVDSREAAACVMDQYTGLTWELKTSDQGLHDWHHTYSWFDPTEVNDPEGLDYRGTPAAGSCAGSDCDTWSFVEAVNGQGLCGHSDWRMPRRDELGTISDVRRVQNPPTANTDFFDEMQAGEYWSGNDYGFQWDAAWVWNYQYGHDRVEWKKSPRHVRLVRGEVFDPRLAKQ